MNNMSNGEATGNSALALLAKLSINLKINGTEHQIEVAPWVTLLDLLRERLDLTIRGRITHD